MPFRSLSLAFLLVVLPAAAFGESLLGSIGRLENIRTPGTCSAALIAPDIVATAAHCASLDAILDQEFPTRFFRPAAPSGAERVAIVGAVHHPLYAPDLGDAIWRFPFDLALLRLARPLPGTIHPPLPLGQMPEIGELLTLASWRAQDDTPVVRECEVISSPSTVVRLDCQVRGGESGAGIIRMTESGPEIAATLTSRLTLRQIDIAQASHLEGRVAPMKRALEALEEGG